MNTILDLPVISCDNCGACCRHMRTPPFTVVGGDPDWEALPQELKDEIDQWETHVRDVSLPEDWPCLWLDLATMKCKHYEHRPDICSDFELGSPACESHREHWRSKAV